MVMLLWYFYQGIIVSVVTDVDAMVFSYSKAVIVIVTSIVIAIVTYDTAFITVAMVFVAMVTKSFCYGDIHIYTYCLLYKLHS